MLEYIERVILLIKFLDFFQKILVYLYFTIFMEGNRLNI